MSIVSEAPSSNAPAARSRLPHDVRMAPSAGPFPRPEADRRNAISPPWREGCVCQRKKTHGRSMTTPFVRHCSPGARAPTSIFRCCEKTEPRCHSRPKGSLLRRTLGRDGAEKNEAEIDSLRGDLCAPERMSPYIHCSGSPPVSFGSGVAPRGTSAGVSRLSRTTAGSRGRSATVSPGS